MPYIYKITNDVDDMIYIGKTSHENPYDRFREHIKDSKKDRSKNRQLYKHMNKYGREHFHFNVIEEVENDEIACERESYWIEFYDTYRNGLNGTLGGDGKSYLKLNEEEVITYHTTIAEYVCGRTANYFSVDKKTIKLILKRNNIKWKSSAEISIDTRGKKIYMINKENEKINFNTISEASDYLINQKCLNKTNKQIQSNISRALRSSGVAYGYKWYYEH